MSLPSRERGLKFTYDDFFDIFYDVAPFAGAWIEIQFSVANIVQVMRSLPSRERGLKCNIH